MSKIVENTPNMTPGELLANKIIEQMEPDYERAMKFLESEEFQKMIEEKKNDILTKKMTIQKASSEIYKSLFDKIVSPTDSYISATYCHLDEMKSLGKEEFGKMILKLSFVNNQMVGIFQQQFNAKISSILTPKIHTISNSIIN